MTHRSIVDFLLTGPTEHGGNAAMGAGCVLPALQAQRHKEFMERYNALNVNPIHKPVDEKRLSVSKPQLPPIEKSRARLTVVPELPY